MPRLVDVEARTFRIHIPTYTYILDYFGSSSHLTGIKASDAVREALIQLGLYCKSQMDAQRQASASDICEIQGLIHNRFKSDTPSQEPSAPSQEPTPNE